MSEKETSDFSLSRVECPKCGAVWINGQHYWRTGYTGNEADLAGLVCKQLGDFQCINPQKNAQGGDTWAKRLEEIDKLMEEIRDR